MHAMLSYYSETELHNLNLKTWPKQLLGSLLLDIALSSITEQAKARGGRIRDDGLFKKTVVVQNKSNLLLKIFCELFLNYN